MTLAAVGLAVGVIVIGYRGGFGDIDLKLTAGELAGSWSGPDAVRMTFASDNTFTVSGFDGWVDPLDGRGRFASGNGTWNISPEDSTGTYESVHLHFRSPRTVLVRLRFADLRWEPHHGVRANFTYFDPGAEPRTHRFDRH
jgi:hypothetical protein